MDQTIFWAIFHSAWGEDRGDMGLKTDKYNKEAWLYVQSKLEKYFEEQRLKNTSKN